MKLLFLPEPVLGAYEDLLDREKQEIQELRFRLGGCVTALYPRGERVLGRGIPVTEPMLEEILARATGFSPYALRLEEMGLYLPLEEGCRLGLCGEGVVKDGRLQGIRRLSGLNLRLARQKLGIGTKTARQLTEQGKVSSCLIVSPPGGGKTTFLRDLIRCISERGFRVSVADERRELGGGGCLELGPCTDVLWGVPKAQAIPLLIRAMNPQVLAVDEIGGEGELEEICYGAMSGVAMVATAHGTGKQSLLCRPLYRKALESGAFEWLITLEALGKPRMERLIQHGEMDGCPFCGHSLLDGGLGSKTETGKSFKPAAAAGAGAGADAGRAGAEYAASGKAV